MLISKRLLLVLVLTALLAVVVACGGGGADVPPEEEEAAATEAPAEEATPTEEAMAEEAVPTEEMAATEEAMAEEAAPVECTDPLGCVTVAPDDPIRIASALVIAGPNETLGIDSQTGVEVAIQEQGDLLGRSIELQAEDAGCSAEGGQTAATKIASDDTIVAVVGHNCSSSCTPAAPIYNDAGMTMISPSCTAPALTSEDSHVPSFLRTCHNDQVQGRVMAEFVYNQLGLRKAATIHDGSPYAEQLQQVFADVFTELGGEVTAQEAVNVGDTDMRPVLTSIATGEPEFLYYPIFIAEGAFITTQAKEVDGLENTILAGADGMISPDFVSAAGEASEGMIISGPFLSFTGDQYEQFLAGYQEILGQEPVSAFHAHAYDAAHIIFDAVEEVAQEGADGSLLIGRQALRDAIYGTEGFDGITGTLTCDESGDCADPQITINQIQNGEYVPVFQGGEWVNELIGRAAEVTAGEPAPAETAEPAPAETAEPEGEAAEQEQEAAAGDYDTEFPLPDDVSQFISVGDEGQTITYQTGLTLPEVAEFYRQALINEQGLTEREITTVVSDEVINLVFDGGPDGNSVVVQGFGVDAETRQISVRYEGGI